MQHADNNLLEEIARKIAAMEKMTDASSGATQGEIENATALIQKLLTKHNLSIEHARTLANNDPKQRAEIAIEIERTPFHGARKFEWEKDLAECIARAFFCKLLWDRFGFMFIGTRTDALIAIRTYNRLRPLFDAMATTATTAYADDWRGKGVMDIRQLRGPHSLKAFRLSYLNGAVAGISRKLTEQRAIDEAANAGQVTALVVSRDIQIDAHIKVTFGKVRYTTAPDNRHNDDAYQRGVKDGYAVNLHKGELSDDRR